MDMSYGTGQSANNGTVGEIADKVNIDAWRDQVMGYAGRLETMIRERPAVMLAAAVGVGFVIGRLVRRR